MRNHIIGGLAIVLAAASIPTAADAVSATVNCPGESIADALIGFDEITVNGTCTEDVEIRRDDVTIQGDPNDGPDTIVGQVFITGAHRVTIQDLAISNSQFHGIAAVDGAAVAVARVTVDNVADVGILGTTGAVMKLDQVTVQNSGSGFGISFDDGVTATVSGSTIEDNSATAISVFRGSSAVIEGSTIEGSSEGISMNTQSIGWLRGNTISNTGADDAAIFVGWESSARMLGGNTIASPGFAIFLEQGATLNQRNGDAVNGPVTIVALSNAEFRNVRITGKVDVVDHSLLRIKDQSSGPPHVSVKGGISVSQDSGLNFIRLTGERQVRVDGSITCADTESSISAPPSNVMISGSTNCTGYNN